MQKKLLILTAILTVSFSNIECGKGGKKDKKKLEEVLKYLSGLSRGEQVSSDGSPA